MDGIYEVRANVETHPEFGVTLDEARVCFQKHKSKQKLKKYAVSLLKPKGKQVVDVEYNL